MESNPRPPHSGRTLPTSWTLGLTASWCSFPYCTGRRQRVGRDTETRSKTRKNGTLEVQRGTATFHTWTAAIFDHSEALLRAAVQAWRLQFLCRLCHLKYKQRVSGRAGPLGLSWSEIEAPGLQRSSQHRRVPGPSQLGRPS